jgi:hypothetical protein
VGRRRFQMVVPQAIRDLPIADLDLPETVEAKLYRLKMDTVGTVLLVWGRNPRLVVRDEAEIAILQDALQNVDGVVESWLSDAPGAPTVPIISGTASFGC